jgi:hypothetical protein
MSGVIGHNTVRVVRTAQRRLFLAALVECAGRWLTWGAAGSLLLVGISRVLPMPVPMWTLIAAPLAAGAAVGGLAALRRRGTNLSAAMEVDRTLGLKDRIGTATDIESRGNTSDPFVGLAISEAETASASADVRKAVPVRAGNLWIAWPALATMAAAIAVWVPVWDIVGARHQREREEAILRQRVQEQIAAATVPTKPKPDATLEPARHREQTESDRVLDEVRKELESGAATPQAAAERAAREFDKMAAAREQAATASEKARERVDQAVGELKNDADAGEKDTSDIARALRSGDLAEASKAAQELLNSDDGNNADRAKAAEEMSKLAEDLRRAAKAVDDAQRLSEKRRPEPTPEGSQGEKPSDPAQASPHDRDSGNPSTEDLARSLERAAEAIRREQAQPPKQEHSQDASKNDGHPDTQPTNPDAPKRDEKQGAKGESKPSKGTPESSPQSPEKSQSASREQAGKETQPPSEQPRNHEQGSKQDQQRDGEPRQSDKSQPNAGPDRKQETPSSKDGSEQRGTQSGAEKNGERTPEKSPANSQPSDEKKPGESASKSEPTESGAAKPESGEPGESNTPKPGSKQDAEKKPSDARTAGEKPQGEPASKPEPAKSGTAEPKSGERGESNAPKPGESQSGEQNKPEPTPAENGKNPAQDSASKPQPGDSQPASDAKEQPGSQQTSAGDTGKPSQNPGQKDELRKDSSEKHDGAKPAQVGSDHKTPPPGPPGEKPQQENAAPQPHEGSPTESPDKQVEAGDKLQKPGAGQQPPGELPKDIPEPSREGIKRLADQIDRLANASKDAAANRQQAQRFRQQADEMLKNASPQQREQIDRWQNAVADEMQKRHPGDGGENQDQRSRRGPGDGVGQPVARDNNTPAATGKETVDARSRPTADSKPRERVIAEWYADKKADRSVGEGSPALSSEGQDLAREAAREGERAVESQIVPSRFDRLLQKYFQRLPQRAGAPAAPSEARPVEPAKDAPGAGTP